MNYECGHDGCDICGARRCDDPSISLETIRGLLVCKPCVHRSVKFALEAAQTFGGILIDPAKDCKRPRRGNTYE